MKTPALRHLMAAYFHQDFDLDGTPEEIVQTFLEDEPDLAEMLATEIAWTLDEHTDERQLMQFLDSLGNYYAVDMDGTRYRDWLLSISRKASAHRSHA